MLDNLYGSGLSKCIYDKTCQQLFTVYSNNERKLKNRI